MKTCEVCNDLKPLSEFYHNRTRKDGLSYCCKRCSSEYQKKYYIKNGDKIRNASNEWARKHPDELRLKNKQYAQNNAHKVTTTKRKWEADNKDKVLAYAKKFRILNRDNPRHRLRHSMSQRIYSSLKGNKSRASWEGLVNYNISELKRHLEKQFTEGMTWGNYGVFWHVDHMIPVAAFNYETPNDLDFKRCWGLKNLQPLEAHKNLTKGMKLEKPFQPCLMLGCVNA